MCWRPLKLSKNHRFSNTRQTFPFLSEHNILKDLFTTTLYLLYFIGCWPTFGVFHYAKLSSYKRERWGRLAGPSFTLKRRILTSLRCVFQILGPAFNSLLLSIKRRRQRFLLQHIFSYWIGENWMCLSILYCKGMNKINPIFHTKISVLP